jgi:transcription-repair coupling factor (superfamily II helicase)
LEHRGLGVLGDVLGHLEFTECSAALRVRLPLRDALAVAKLRQTCRRHGVTEVATQGAAIRFAPMPLKDSQLVRLRRLHPKAVYKESVSTVSVPRPTEGAAGGRMGAPQLRDQELLDWCAHFLQSLAGSAVSAATGA